VKEVNFKLIIAKYMQSI